MEPALKQRLIGAVVISALAIVFLPRFIVGHDKDSPAADVSLKIPGAPDRNFETRELPLTSPGATPPGGVVGMNTTAPPLPSPATSPAPAATDADGNPLPADATAPAVAATPPAALPGKQGAAPATVAAGSTSAQPAPAAPGAQTPAVTVPPATVPAAPIPAAHAGGNYVVNAGLYGNVGNAQSLVNSLKAAQLPAYAETASVNGKSGMRVRIGPFAQRGDAEAARLRAQQVRSDMTATVVALDAATEAPAPKPAVAPVLAKPAAVSAVAAKPVAVNAPSAAPKSTTTPVPAAPAAAKPATAALAAPAATGRGYVVQVSAFRTEEEALALRNRLRAAGFTAFSERVQLDSGTLYRVRVGPTADRDAADQLRLSLSQKMSLSGMVVAYP